MSDGGALVFRCAVGLTAVTCLGDTSLGKCEE